VASPNIGGDKFFIKIVYAGYGLKLPGSYKSRKYQLVLEKNQFLKFFHNEYI